MPRLGLGSAPLLLGLLPAVLGGCSAPRSPYGATDSQLGLSRVVLYRNGVGYFERVGRVDGDTLVLRVRKDQANDLLKSLTIVERATGRAVSVSVPLDPTSWANAALAKLAPGNGSLHEVLDALRGARVTLGTNRSSWSGRIVMVERIEREPDEGREEESLRGKGGEVDYRVTLLDDGELRVVRLSTVESITLLDGALTLQFHRSLDASAGEGMFQQIDLSIRLAGASSHDLAVSYVVAAPMWKPTYRLVLPEQRKGKALLQGWAVVDNTSGEDWAGVQLSLTSGSPIAFRYDLHTPRDVERVDLSEVGSRRQARAAVGETTFAEEAEALEDEGARAGGSGPVPALAPAPPGAAMPEAKKAAPRRERAPSEEEYASSNTRGTLRSEVSTPPPPAIDAEALGRSALVKTRARTVSGLVQFDLQEKLTIPDGSSTMVAVVNQNVEGEETYLYRPGGAGAGFEQNPYRVVRFRNTTPFVLEPGPISIYAGGSFVGEGLSEAVGTGVSATVPFAVEPNLFVSSTTRSDGDEIRLVKIVRGVLEVENFSRRTTVYEVRGQKQAEPVTLLIRHSKAGPNYALAPRPAGTEDLPDAYLVPVQIARGSTESTLQIVEQTPSRTTLSIWDPRAPQLFDTLLAGSLSPELRKKLEPIVQRRQEVGRIDTQIEGLKHQQIELDQRAAETRNNLEALKRDPAPAAAALRKRLGERLEQFTKDGDKIGREIVELTSKRLERKIELEDLLQNFDFTP